MRRIALLVAFLVVSPLGIATVATAGPQPVPICGVCGASFERGADLGDDRPDPTVVESTATIQVHGDGSATWRVANELENASTAAYYDRNPGALARLVDDAIGYSIVDRPFANVSASVDGSTIHVRFEDLDAVRQTPGGVQIVSYFHAGGGQPWVVVAADRITVVGPEGTTVANDPPGVDVDGRSATWYGSATGSLWEAPRLETQAYVAYADSEAELLTTASLFVTTVPVLLTVIVRFYLPALALLSVGVVPLAIYGGRCFRRPDLPEEGQMGRAVAGLGVVSLLVVVAGNVWLQRQPTIWIAAVGLLYTLVGGVAVWRGARVQIRDLLVAGVLAAVGGALLVAGTALGDELTPLQGFRRGLRTLWGLSPLVVMLHLGDASTTGDPRERKRALSFVLGAFVAASLTVVWPFQHPFGASPSVLVLGALGVVLAGLPLFVLGGVIDSGSE